MLLRVGLPEPIVHRIMHCVKSVTFRVKANGQKSEMIFPRRVYAKVIHYPCFYFLFAKSGSLVTCPAARTIKCCKVLNWREAYPHQSTFLRGRPPHFYQSRARQPCGVEKDLGHV